MVFVSKIMDLYSKRMTSIPKHGAKRPVLWELWKSKQLDSWDRAFNVYRERHILDASTSSQQDVSTAISIGLHIFRYVRLRATCDGTHVPHP